MHKVKLVQLLSQVRLFVTPRTAACQAFLSFTIFQSLLKLMATVLMIVKLTSYIKGSKKLAFKKNYQLLSSPQSEKNVSTLSSQSSSHMVTSNLCAQWLSHASSVTPWTTAHQSPRPWIFQARILMWAAISSILLQGISLAQGTRTRSFISVSPEPNQILQEMLIKVMDLNITQLTTCLALVGELTSNSKSSHSKTSHPHIPHDCLTSKLIIHK